MTAYVCFNSWAGRTKARVTVLKKCTKRSKVRFEEQAFWRPAGHVQYVPNTAIVAAPMRQSDSNQQGEQR